MSQPVEIPRHVDDPPTLLLWRIDDLVPVAFDLDARGLAKYGRTTGAIRLPTKEPW